MLLKKIIIQNYRSIEHLEIDILEIAGCRIHPFFGINETGKSNILKAISLLSQSETVQYEEDCNKTAKKHSESIILRCVFEITKTDNLEKELSSLSVPVDLPVSDSNVLDPLHIEKIIEFDETSQRTEYYGILPYEITSEFKDFKSDSLGLLEAFSTVVVATADILNRSKIEKCINAEAKSLFDNLVPEVIFWEPSDKYLIINPINLESFRKNPDNSIPLKHIFQLCDYDDNEIRKNIERIQRERETQKEFGKELSRAITGYINGVWPEHQINIIVEMDSNYCDIYVEDKNNVNQIFNMKQRSDGFKQFVSILLSLSLKNITNQLQNKIILLDEPERSLHPGSIKYLRDELLKISKNNIVLASSHSIFMVDKKNLERHYTVTKEDSTTKIEQVDPTSPIQDDVIYNALGTSIFEIIEPYMLIFEGRTDKDIFDAFTRKFGEIIEPISIQTISATGANQIPKYAKFFHNKLVNGYAVVDSDKDGRYAIKEIKKEDREFANSVFELNELIEIDKKDRTLEDILPKSLIRLCANSLYGINFEIPEDKPILKSIKEIKVKEKIHTDGKLKDLKKSIVDNVLDDIQHKSIEELEAEYQLYVQFLTNLHAKIK